jgi:glycosyltransferase involved in cell wall biosynthesis
MNPLISIIMPAYNAEKYIAPALASILGQTYENFELIIIDDGSTDNTYDIIRSFRDERIYLIRNPKNLKLPRSLNVAIDAAKGHYICRSDADDVNISIRLQTQVEFMESHPEIDVVGANMYVFDEDGHITGGLRLKNSYHNELIRQIHWFTPLMHATIMARAAWLRKHKYREAYPRAEDYELFLRSYRESRFASLPAFLYAVRDPGRVHTMKLLRSSWDNMVMRWRHWQDYGLPIRCVIGYPLLVAARLLYYSIAIIKQRSFYWAHLQPVDLNDTFLRDQEWVRQCLRQGTHGYFSLGDY